MFMRVPAFGDRQGVSLSAHATSIPPKELTGLSDIPTLQLGAPDNKLFVLAHQSLARRNSQALDPFPTVEERVLYLDRLSSALSAGESLNHDCITLRRAYPALLI